MKDGEYTICPSCFVTGRFPSAMYSGDFVRLDEEAFKHASAGADWSDEETLLLLEGVEMYDDDWQRVGEHVGTRSKEQCIAKFLQLPIEDSYLHADPGSDIGPLRYQAGVNGLPFESSENPVMSVVTFLASAVGPSVAAAAAQSALGELTKGLKRKRAETDGEKANGEAEGVNGTNDADIKEESADIAETGDEVVNGDATSTSGPSRTSVQRAAQIAIGAAAAKATTLARYEDIRLSQLVSRLVAAQTRKVELKLKIFERMEDMLEKEKRKVELGRQELFQQRVTVQKSLDSVEILLRQAREAAAQAQAARQAQMQAQVQARAQAQAQAGAGGVQPPLPGPSPADAAAAAATASAVQALQGVEQGMQSVRSDMGQSTAEATREVPVPQSLEERGADMSMEEGAQVAQL